MQLTLCPYKPGARGFVKITKKANFITAAFFSLQKLFLCADTFFCRRKPDLGKGAFKIKALCIRLTFKIKAWL